MSYRWLEHTSELELRIDAASEQDVFGFAAAALGELVAEEPDEGDARGEAAAPATLTFEIGVQGRDRPAQLVAFLEELVYLIETEDLVPEDAQAVRLSRHSVTATARGRRGRPSHIVKGVTYSDLTFAPKDGGFAATVVLDV